jgi:hypothetical protein
MSSSAKRDKRPTVPVRPLLSDAPAEPGVYHSCHQLGGRWVYYALGANCAILGCRHPSPEEQDDDVIAQLERLVREEPRCPVLTVLRGGGLMPLVLGLSSPSPATGPRLLP